ncbi:MAG: MFS transporter [Candidatus Paceibacterota bacterium]|nr:MAG: MFS transporter [Candidatus Paceibacterota bacterium]
MFFLSKINSSLRFLFSILASNFLLSLHFALIIYINSTFLEQFFSPGSLGFLFALGAVLNLFFLLRGPELISKFGNYRLVLFFIFLEFLAVLGLALTENPLFVAILFVLHQGTIMTILFCLDIFLENYSDQRESKTGGIRGIYLTLGNLAFVISPALAGLILTNGDFWKIYLVSATLLIPLFFLAKRGLKVKIEYPKKSSLKETFKKIISDKNIFGVFAVQFILQFFFAWMVIYMPIHLSQNLHFSWTEIGLIFTIMLLPFLIFEIPMGWIADKKTGEKEIMTIGFLIIASSTAITAFLNSPVFIIWALVLFMTRVGASFTEIASESYFFKKVRAGEPDIISFFRISRPLALIVAPLIAAGVLTGFEILNIQYSFLFLVLSIIVLFGIKYSLSIEDTR